MRAVVWRDIEHEATVEQVVLDPPQDGEVLVRIAAAGVCHSDLHVVRGDWPGIAAPMVLGHEGSGVIERVGPGVDGLAVGDHVVLSWIAPCGRCRNCRAGRPAACLVHAELVSERGVLQDGTSRLHRDDEPVFHYSGVSSFAEFAVVPAAGAIKVRPDAPLDVISLIGCAVATGVGAVRNTAQVPSGSSVVVVGCGGVGLSVVQGARMAGASTIIAVDLVEEKLEVARALGATHTIDGTKGDVLADIQEISPGGADYAFDAIGGRVTTEQCLASLAVGGTVILVGIPRSGTSASFEPQRLVDLGQRILGSNYGGIVPAVDIPRLVDQYVEGELLLDAMVSARLPLTDANAALLDLERGAALRQLLIPSAS